MADIKLKEKVTDEELLRITSPKILCIMKTIKSIQNRMKDVDNANLQYIEIYDKLGKEFSDFADSYTTIFTKVIRGENLNLIASVLYYRDKMEQGLITEAELGDMLSKKYMPANLKTESDKIIGQMREDGQI